ncbi:MAG: hypothetical protein IPO67_08270 [Deltaproteobacteria bacterium]|nr:hypothetical protein [Deltaproteobacteria bacterium]
MSPSSPLRLLLLGLLIVAACKGDTPSPEDSDAPLDDSAAVVDDDGDGVPASADCDDNDATSFPGATETCDGRDNNCDGATDEGLLITVYPDEDGDGFGDPGGATEVCALADGFVTQAGDCEDDDPRFFPGAAESDCEDPNDYNCDGSVGLADQDGDGRSACEDCDDKNATVFPGATETCDSLDNNCDGAVDEGLQITVYPDADGDGYGDGAAPLLTCSPPEDSTLDGADCDDGDARVNPVASETCDNIDNNCDSLIDDEDPALDLSTATASYADDDKDGFGDPSTLTQTCLVTSGRVTTGDDCDDGAAAVNPGATELCDGGRDNDCDGLTDDDDPSLSAASATRWYADSDGDGAGDAASSALACLQPSGFVSGATDCDDGDKTVYPSASEVCDGLDNDCDSLVDDDDPGRLLASTTAWYDDLDADGYGDASASTRACDAPSAAVADDGDCDDADPNINPGAAEACDDLDNDCDGVTDQVVYFESDLDGGLPAGIVLNGDATWIRAGTDGAVRLTSIDYYQVGAALLTDTVPADDLVISFRFITGGGDGADGLALGLLDPSTPDTAIGVYGEGLGLYGLTGYAVELDTYTNYPKDPDNNHIALMDTTTLNALVSSSSVPNLDDGVERLLELTKSGDDFTVTLDGATVFTYTLTGFPYSEVRVALAASTGGLTNNHYFDDLTVMCP